MPLRLVSVQTFLLSGQRCHVTCVHATVPSDRRRPTKTISAGIATRPERLQQIELSVPISSSFSDTRTKGYIIIVVIIFRTMWTKTDLSFSHILQYCVSQNHKGKKFEIGTYQLQVKQSPTGQNQGKSCKIKGL
jgi:hypothetical protein